jgi:hypothetical protein
MKTLISSLLLTTIIALTNIACAANPAASERPPELSCDTGPLHKSYGSTNWLVYSCNDKKSAVVVADEGNPAQPFYFILYIKPDGDLHIYGEGSGKKEATSAAFDELKLMTPQDVASLVEATKSVSSSIVK